MGIDPHGGGASPVPTVRSYPCSSSSPEVEPCPDTWSSVASRQVWTSPWMRTYVSADRRTSFCIYDGPSPEAIRRTATRNRLPVDSITEVRVLDPYFYR